VIGRYMRNIDLMRVEANRLLEQSRQDPSFRQAYEKQQSLVEMALRDFRCESLTLDADEAEMLRFLIDENPDFFEALGDVLTDDELKAFEDKLRGRK
jgi:hypothetical protein